MKTVSIAEVTDFLSRRRKDRAWLAKQVGAVTGTVNNWFSANALPNWAAISIARLIDEYERPTPSATELSFTLEQWKTVQAAAEISGAASVDDFIRQVITQEAERLAEEHRSSAK